MFDNIGGKIKEVAEIVCLIGIILSVIIGLVIASSFNQGGYISILIGVIVGAVGSLLSWLGSFLLYGFGQLVENSDTLVSEFKTPTPSESQPKWRCAWCGKMISSNPCPYCNNSYKGIIKPTSNTSVKGTCAICNAENVDVIECKISNDTGYYHFKKLCPDCIAKRSSEK